MRPARCTCAPFAIPGDDGGICSFCERAEEEAEADERNEAHARDPESEDFGVAACEACGGQGQDVGAVCCGSPNDDGSCCGNPVQGITGWCADCGGSGAIPLPPLP